MYAAAGGASIAGRKARHARGAPATLAVPAASTRRPSTVPRAFSCHHWEARVRPPPVDRIVAFGSRDLSPSCECAQGRAAWQEAAARAAGAAAAADAAAAVAVGRRCSVAGARTRNADQHRKWMHRNRVHDASYGSSSDSDCESDWEWKGGEPRGAARLLYVGLGALAVGLVVSFVGTGDKGFKTPELRLVGPAFVLVGLFCCVLRVLLCCRPCTCFAKCCFKTDDDKNTRRISIEATTTAEELQLVDRTSLLGVVRHARHPGGPATCSPARRRPSSSDSSAPPSPSSPLPAVPAVAWPSPEPSGSRMSAVDSSPAPARSSQANKLSLPTAPARTVSFGELVLSPSQLRP